MGRRRVESLAARHPWRLDLPVLLVVSFVLLAMGLTMPAMEIRAFLFWRDQYSIITNIQSLYEDKQHTAAMALAACSVAYPAIKIATLFFLWIVPFPAGWRSGLVRALRLLGRWSLVDVFAITAIVVGSQAIGPLQARPLAGVYVYAASIFVLMIVTVLMDRLARHGR